MPAYGLWEKDAKEFLSDLPNVPLFDCVISSPPYNIGKAYEDRVPLQTYLDWQDEIVTLLIPRLKSHGSVCWQVGNYVENGWIEPLDAVLHPLFRKHGLVLRNRIVWNYGHGLHCRRRFSPRYEVVLWYTREGDYVFDLDKVRIGPKYPGKRHYKGPNIGKVSSNPKGKNPEDVWEFQGDLWKIPNVKGNHREKTLHPCQFPVGLVERLILALTKPLSLVFDPFCGVGSAGVAAAIHNRHFWGCDTSSEYINIAKKRIADALRGKAVYRPHDQLIYDPAQSRLSQLPEPS